MPKDTFRGGVHPNDQKALTRDSQLQVYEATGDMVFPLSQHIGKPSKAVVKKNDEVLVGQVIAEADGFVSANIVSSCSGKVKAIEKRRTLSGTFADCIVIENDGEFRTVWNEDDYSVSDVSELTDDEILGRIKNAGIVGLGGAGFPTHVKLKPRDPSAIRYIIANGAECEPYITCNDQLMRTEADALIDGLAIMLRLFPNAEGVIGIEKNKPEAIEAMTKAAEGKERIRVLPLQTKYPQGGERNLISVIAGVDFPANQLPADVGCIVENVGTIYAIQRAVRFKEPLIRHGITVSGDAVANPGNFDVRIGTSFYEVLEAAGGIKEGKELLKALAGGPMMGIAMSSLDVPIQKTSNALTVLTTDENVTAEEQMTACLRCGRCGTVCPVGLLPQLMACAIEKGDMDRYENKLYGLECVACGSCSYICPAKRPLMQMFKQTKAEILAQKRAAMMAGGTKK